MAPNEFSEPTLDPDVVHRLAWSGFSEAYVEASYAILIQQSNEAQRIQMDVLEGLWHDDWFCISGDLPTPSSVLKELPPVHYEPDAVDAQIAELPAQWRDHVSEIVHQLPFDLQELELKEIAKIIEDAGENPPPPSADLPLEAPSNAVQRASEQTIPNIIYSERTPFTPIGTPRRRTSAEIPGVYSPLYAPSHSAHLGANTSTSSTHWNPPRTVLGASRIANRPTSYSGRWVSSKRDWFEAMPPPVVDRQLEEAEYHSDIPYEGGVEAMDQSIPNFSSILDERTPLLPIQPLEVKQRVQRSPGKSKRGLSVHAQVGTHPPLHASSQTAHRGANTSTSSTQWNPPRTVLGSSSVANPRSFCGQELSSKKDSFEATPPPVLDLELAEEDERYIDIDSFAYDGGVDANYTLFDGATGTLLLSTWILVLTLSLAIDQGPLLDRQYPSFDSMTGKFLF